jgi:hypothetical protein
MRNFYHFSGCYSIEIENNIREMGTPCMLKKDIAAARRISAGKDPMGLAAYVIYTSCLKTGEGGSKCIKDGTIEDDGDDCFDGGSCHPNNHHKHHNNNDSDSGGGNPFFTVYINKMCYF